MKEPKRYTKNPIEIEAIQFTGDNFRHVNAFIGKSFPAHGEMHWGFLPVDKTPQDVVAEVYDKLHDTWVGVKEDQWIIKGTQGEFYPCDPIVFAETYKEAVDLPDGWIEETSYYCEDTMMKVAEVLRECGYLPGDIPEVVSKFQNVGILFRERVPSP